MKCRVVAFAFAVVAVAVAYRATPAEACSCAPPPGPEASYARSTAVFTGTVDSIAETANGFAVTFTVTQMFKGPGTAQVTVETARDSAACGYNFTAGASYLVYAGGELEALRVNICSRTAPADRAADDIGVLDAMLHGNGKAPEEPTGPAEPPPTDTVDPGDPGPEPAPPPQTVQRKGCGCTGGTSDAGGGLLVLAVIALVARRRLSSSAR